MAFLDKTGLERLWLHILSKTNQTLASAKQYADDIKNDLLNGAGGAYDTLKELGDLIDENADAIDAIERLADTKSDKGHIHDDRYYTETEVDDALKFVKEASGEVITVNDSAEQNLVGLKLYGKTTQATTTGKNLLPYPYDHGSNTNAGITFAVNDDGSVTVSGTATAQARFIFHLLDAGSRVYLPAGKYTFSGNPDPNISMAIYLYSDNTTSEFLMWKDISNGSTYTFELSEPAYYGAYCVISAGATVNATVKPILEAGSAATSYEPYTGGIPSPNPNYPQPLVSPGDSGSIDIAAQGKNLIYSINKLTEKTVGGITFTPVYRQDGSLDYINVNGTCTAANWSDYDLIDNTTAAKTYSMIPKGQTVTLHGSIMGLSVCVEGGEMGLFSTNGNIATATLESDEACMYLRVWAGSTISNAKIYPMLNFGEIASPYEPIIQRKFLTVSTPNGLPGIPVTSGGNYTDANGQMWICDEIDFEHGVYVKRIGKKIVAAEDIRSAESISTDFIYTNVIYYTITKQDDNANKGIANPRMGLCDKFTVGTVNNWDSAAGINLMLTNADYRYDWFGFAPGTTIDTARSVMVGMTMLYVLSTPIETPLSESELSAYRAMSSQKPNTTIYNDAGAGMIVEYADVKIDDIEKALNLPEIDAALAEKVDKVAGKGLSTNDFTTAEKEKLSRLSETGNVEVDSELSDNSENPVQNKVINDALKFLKKSEGSIVTITDGAAHPAVELISHIEPLQEGSGEPSPDNVRPINGWDTVDITRTGKNLFGGSVLAETLKDKANATIDANAGTVSIYAPEVDGKTILDGVFKPNTQYTIILYGRNIASEWVNMYIAYTDGTQQYLYFPATGSDSMLVIQTDSKKTVKEINGMWGSTTTILYYDKCGVFEGTLDASDFIPYEGQTLTASLPETVYGGTLNWTTSMLTVPYKKDIINAAESVYSVSDTLIIGTVSKSDILRNSRSNGLCDALPSANTIFGISSPCIVFGINDTVIYFALPVDRVGTTLETLNAYLATNPLTIMYPLATPYTIQLTPQQLFTLHGTNNVWSDCGETELTYATIRTDEIEKVLIDPTLSITGIAADAQIVGKELQHLQKETQFLDEAKGGFITVDNSAELPLNNLKLYGKTEQNTTTGKNLLNAPEELTFVERQMITLEKALPPGTYTVSALITSNDTDDTENWVGFVGGDEDGSNAYVTLQRNTRNSGTITIYKTVATVFFNASSTLSPSEGDTATVYQAQIEAGTIATDYEPYTGGAPSPSPNYPQPLVSPGDNGSIEVHARGKNLAPDKAEGYTTDIGTSYRVKLVNPYSKTVTMKITDKNNGVDVSECYIGMVEDPLDAVDPSTYIWLVQNGNLTTTETTNTFKYIFIYPNTEEACNRVFARYNVQVEYGNTATVYESYKDGGTLAISTPNGLPGIPVSRDGNYVDTNGQRWICDEIDLDRGVRKTKIRKLVFDGSADENWYGPYMLANTTNLVVYTRFGYNLNDISALMCDRFPVYTDYISNKPDGTIGVAVEGVDITQQGAFFGVRGIAATNAEWRTWLAAHPITILIPAQENEPEISISEAELAAYRAMLTQYPTTTIYNDAAADMYVSYGTYKAGEMEEALGIPKADKTLSIEGAPADAKTVGDILNNQYSVKRETGDIISVDTIKGLAIHPTTYIEFIQSGSGDPSPNNVRTINGWDKVQLWRTSKNLFDMSTLIQGDYDGTSPTVRVSQPIEKRPYVYAGVKYTARFNRRDSRDRIWILITDKNNTHLETIQYGNKNDNNGATFTPTQNGYLCLLFGRYDETMSGWAGLTVAEVQAMTPWLEYGDATAYEPYQGKILTATLPETIYSGEVDWATGVLTVTHYKLTFDGVTTGAKLDNTDPGVTTYAYIVDANMPRPLEWYSTAYANRLKSVGTNTVIAFGLPTELTGVTGGDDTLTVTAKYNAVLKQWYDAGEPLEIVYKLATPYTIQLTPQQLLTIEGQNNIWSNAGITEALINLTPEVRILNLVDGSASGSVRGTTNVREGAIIYDEFGKDTGETYTIGENAFAIGTSTMAIGDNSYAEGYSTKAFGDRSHAEGEHNYARGSCSHAEGSATKTIGSGAHSEGQSTTARGSYSHAEGMNTTAEGDGSHAEGRGSTASGGGAHAEGNNSLASAWASHAEGASSATNNYAHAEGINSTASGYGSHAEGNSTTASANYAHAEGTGTSATSDHSHAEGGGTTAEAYAAHAEGTDTVAKGDSSHAEGRETLAEGVQSHAEGYKAQAIGSYSHAEGRETAANGDYSHAEGQDTIASGSHSHAEGYKTQASSYAHAEGWEAKASSYAHAEGYGTTASGSYSHAEGSGTTASGSYSHAEGAGTKASGEYSHAEGIGTEASGKYSHAEGSYSKATNEYCHAEGVSTQATGYYSHAEGASTQAQESSSHAEGASTIAKGRYTHAEGSGTTAWGTYSHAEGYLSSTGETADCAHAEGYNTDANGNGSHSEGLSTLASAPGSHAEGSITQATGYYSHAEGSNTHASYDYAHAEGRYTKATGQSTHAEGTETEARGYESHAEGYATLSSGIRSHAEGLYTIAAGEEQHVQGRFNIEDATNTYAHIVGNGGSQDKRSNAHTLDWDGNAWFAGTVEGTGIILKSSVSGSTKRFLITVNDSGTLSTTEIT